MSATLVPGAVADTAWVKQTPVPYLDTVDVGDGRTPIVLVHGTGGTPATHFGYMLPMLASRGRVVAVTLTDPALRGSQALTVDDFAEQVVAVIAHVLPGQRVALVGYSLGAVVATVVAAEHPDLLESLTLLAGWAQTDAQQVLRNDVWRELRSSGSAILKEFSVWCAFGGPYLAARSRDEIQPFIDVVTVTDFTEAQMDLNRSIDIRDFAVRVEAPTLIVAGLNDQMVPVRHQKYLFGAIEDSRYTEINSGHAMVFERPAELLRLIERFTTNPREYGPGEKIPTLKP